VREDLPDDRRIVQRADQAQPAPTVRIARLLEHRHHFGLPLGHGGQLEQLSVPVDERRDPAQQPLIGHEFESTLVLEGQLLLRRLLNVVPVDSSGFTPRADQDGEERRAG
jgi:hypothetical protein